MSERPPSANIPTLTEVVSRPAAPTRPGALAPVAAPPAGAQARAAEAAGAVKNPVVQPIVAPPGRAQASSAVAFESTAVLEGDQVVPAPAGRLAPAAPGAAAVPTAPAPAAAAASAPSPAPVASSAASAAAPPPAVAVASLPQPAVGNVTSGAANDSRRSAVRPPPGRPPEPAATAPSGTPPSSPPQVPTAAPPPRSLRPPAPSPSAAAQLPAASEGELVDRVLAHLQRQVDLALEVKLREVLTPLLTRASDNVVREAKRELTTVMRELVSRAISQELARRGKLP